MCGLGKILPISSRENCWTEQACQMFKTLTKGQQLRAYFLQQGLFSNSFYIFLSSVGVDGGIVHINTALCAFDKAIADVTGLHQPICSFDTPCL